uniref:Cytochrome c oxidase subunit 2 n=1 Tax=Virgulibracon endoxylaphagus TaxID=2933211 RepID=A0A8T9JE30_9HYME|nr:cytochrome c oxidase subunit II [Virgulibracon endoxylaphagus]UOK09626.1 cytochrome c oxidase subunit II [Virgulibracon endoxylaphagus]
MLYWDLMNFQDHNSYIKLMMTELHDLIFMVLMMIMLFILYLIMWFFLNKFINKNILHNQLIETIWTMIPMLILMFMVVPSLKILYMSEEMINPFLTLKILGHQWYWSYEYSEFKKIEFDSFMMMDFNNKYFRLLEVDNRLIVPFKLNIRNLISSVDVIHSWCIPSLGVKLDAIPGRLNQCYMNLNRLGVYFGQCSEICGLNHSFMPISIESVNLNTFINWLKLF